MKVYHLSIITQLQNSGAPKTVCSVFAYAHEQQVFILFMEMMHNKLKTNTRLLRRFIAECLTAVEITPFGYGEFMTQDVHDAIVIGSGPAGYTAAIYLGRAGHQPLIIAGALTPGGQLVNTTEVENFPGFPEGILGPDLMENMRAQAEKFGAEIEYDDVTSVDFSGPVKLINTDSGTQYKAKTVIVTTGSEYRKLGVPGEQEYSGRGVSYCATCDGFFFKDKPIVVVGGGDSAMEEADFLSRYGSSVTVIHRREGFRASKIMVDRAIDNPNITFKLNTVVTEVTGDDNGANTIALKDTVTGQVSSIQANGIFVAIGYTPQTGFLKDAIELDNDGYIMTKPDTTNTSVPGVFAAGDAVDRVYRQAISAAGSGCKAALDAQHYLSTFSLEEAAEKAVQSI